VRLRTIGVWAASSFSALRLSARSFGAVCVIVPAIAHGYVGGPLCVIVVDGNVAQNAS
jgi:hypothetical protein